MTKLQLKDVAFRDILQAVDVAWNEGAFVGLIGPNGAGKSTLLKVLTNVWAPTAGTVYLDGQSIASLSNRDRARNIAYLPQQVPEDVPFTVRQFVEMGRYAYRRGLAGLTPDCRRAVQHALERLSLLDFADSLMSELSGGERQRVAIARCLAQEAPILVLDEPISNLDLYYQVEILKLLKELAGEGYLIVLAIHHLEFAAQFCSELMLLHHGCLVKTGSPRQVLTEQSLTSVFGMAARVYEDPYSESLRVSIPSAETHAVMNTRG
jgi:ABC-type cobalamin/Fe3+-siderophores transport system ATPase subunit